MVVVKIDIKNIKAKRFWIDIKKLHLLRNCKFWRLIDVEKHKIQFKIRKWK